MSDVSEALMDVNQDLSPAISRIADSIAIHTDKEPDELERMVYAVLSGPVAGRSDVYCLPMDARAIVAFASRLCREIENVRKAS